MIVSQNNVLVSQYNVIVYKRTWNSCYVDKLSCFNMKIIAIKSEISMLLCHSFMFFFHESWCLTVLRVTTYPAWMQLRWCTLYLWSLPCPSSWSLRNDATLIVSDGLFLRYNSMHLTILLQVSMFMLISSIVLNQFKISPCQVQFNRLLQPRHGVCLLCWVYYRFLTWSLRFLMSIKKLSHKNVKQSRYNVIVLLFWAFLAANRFLHSRHLPYFRSYILVCSKTNKRHSRKNDPN